MYGLLELDVTEARKQCLVRDADVRSVREISAELHAVKARPEASRSGRLLRSASCAG